MIDGLLAHDEPAVRWRTRVRVLGEPRESADIAALEDEVRQSARVRALLQHVDVSGRMQVDKGVYAKWQGAHWVLNTLADIGYPRGDTALQPVLDEVLDTWLAPRYFAEFEATQKSDAYKHKDAIPVMQGRHRTCASQQGNALYALLQLGLADARVAQLVERLLYWQWPDGGWNCDKEPSADTSTFIHTLWSMRALGVYAAQSGDAAAHEAVQRASEVFLSRQFFLRASDGAVIRDEFTKLHYPLYWHYDILGALKVFAELGMTDDPRCAAALDLLESKQLADGGWPAEARYYKKVTPEIALGNEYVDWGGTSAKVSNPWVTTDALYVLRCFGRIGAS